MAQVHYSRRARNINAELGRWSLQGRLDWREWDGEFVVRADKSAETHLLPALAGETIKALRDGPAHVEDLAARVFKHPARLSAATADLVATFADPGADMQSLLVVLLDLESRGLAHAELT